LKVGFLDKAIDIDRLNQVHRMGGNMQVITITHLPQIAAKGNAQFFVYKDENKLLTETHIRRLSQEERIQAIAHLLSGAQLTPAAIENAKELLKAQEERYTEHKT
jgi:DNA repair protein RecN (Recombination protein N)